MNPSTGSVPSIDIDVRVGRGLVLPGRAWASERPRAIVGIVHGLGEHSGRYAALASDLVRAHYTVAALDLPGHGDAPGKRGDMPSWPLVRDQVVPAMFTATRGLPGQPPELPRVILGHSMGGVMALDFALAHPRELSAAIISAPGLKSATPPWWKLALANVARVAVPDAGFAHGLPVEGISRIPEVVKAYREDPRVHDKISPRLFFAFEEARQRVLRDARRLQTPTLLLQGMADRMIDPKGTLEFSMSCPHEMVRFVTLKDTFHEIFNDTGREAVVRDAIAWLDAAMVA